MFGNELVSLNRQSRRHRLDHYTLLFSGRVPIAKLATNTSSSDLRIRSDHFGDAGLLERLRQIFGRASQPYRILARSPKDVQPPLQPNLR
ncbi:hypothetical protein BHMPCIPO_06479 [Ensifer sesbaniae]|nr:hypothetical protein [Ensifer sesbaniae]